MVLLAGCSSRGDPQSVKQIVLLDGRSDLRFVKIILLGLVGCPYRSDLLCKKKMVLFGICPSRCDLHPVKKMVWLGECCSRNDL